MKTLIGVAPKLKVFRLFKLRLEHFLFLFFVIALIFFLIPVSRSSLYPEFSSFKIYDRSGNLLREVLSRDYKTSQWADMKEMSPHIIEATILEEDKRFYFHHGVDPIALLRAGYENLKYRKIVSGGSTITMQVAKMVLNLRQRSVFAKLAEIAYALKLEVHLSKKEILEIYLNRIPYGNQTYGVEAASHYYFAKPARQLSLGECCILAIIPKSPSKLNPSISSKLVLQAKKRLLNTLLTNRQVDSLDYFCAINESLAVKPRDINFKAPHFVDFVLNEIDRLGLSPAPDITTSLDLDLQQDLEKLLATTIKSLQIHNVHQGALIVMETKDGEIRAMVGSKNYFDEDEGQVNG